MNDSFFGYRISPSSTMNIDEHEDDKFVLLKSKIQDVSMCMACGSCAGSCTAGQYTPVDLRRVILFLQRGKSALALSQIKHCMLCGKCNLVCPRGINTRRLILAIQEIYDDNQKGGQK